MFHKAHGTCRVGGPRRVERVEVAVRQDDSEIQKEPDVLFRYRVLEMLFSAATVGKLKSGGSRMCAPLLLHTLHATFSLSTPDNRSTEGGLSELAVAPLASTPCPIHSNETSGPS